MLESPDMSLGNKDAYQLYLASNSPRRKELLSLTGWKYTLIIPQVDETPFQYEDGVEYVKRLANKKACVAANGLTHDGLIIAADTAVVDSDANGVAKILGKPGNKNEAIEILRGLRGHTHQVFTAISILSTQDGSTLSDLCATNVPMRNYSEEEIDTYVATGDPLDKAGAYAIQHQGFHPVERLYGCYANVMGLPLCHLTRSLSLVGLSPVVDVAQACQSALNYPCPVFHQILQAKSQSTHIVE